MIVCHEKKIIFVKTKKIGGTSFEIALSKFCGPKCIITPITSTDEDLRKSLGYRRAQNFTKDASSANNQIDFFNHMTSAQICKNLPFHIWKNYKKITIVRNPYEVLVSKYFWRREERNFKDFVMSVMQALMKTNSSHQFLVKTNLMYILSMKICILT